MTTQCTTDRLTFQPLGRREVVGAFDGGTITSDAGGLLLREVERRTGIIRQFAACFLDHRDPELIEHRVEELVGQRVYALALGYEDLNDHDRLRLDPLLATLVGKEDPTGQDRRRERDRGKPLAGKSTLNRLELSPVGADEQSRYKKIPADTKRIERLFVEFFLQAHPQPPERIVLDLDATDDPVHGEQLGRFFHGYYREYCYLPLYIFCGHELLGGWLRPSDIDASAGALKRVAAIVQRLREVWPQVKIVLRCDDACQPTAAVVLRRSLHAHAGAASAGSARDADGRSAMRYDPAEALEDRSSAPGDRAEDLGRLRGRLSL